MQIIAVIPVYNEPLEQLQLVLKDVLSYVDRIIVVDDGSNINYQTIKNNKIILLRHIINRGQGAALRTGTKAALKLNADIIIHLDADGQHSPSYIPKFIEILQNPQSNIDLVLGSRFLGEQAINMPWQRKLLLKLGRYFNIFALGISNKITDPQSGMRAFTRRGAEKINFNQDRMAHASEILKIISHSDIKWQEIPIQVYYSSETLKNGQKNTDAFKIVWQFLISKFLK